MVWHIILGIFIHLTGDLTERVGRKGDDNIIGHFRKEVVNENGERLIKLCELNDLKITNRFFGHKNINRYNRIQVTRNLHSNIDYIIVRENSTTKIKDVRVKRGAECGSDHRLVNS